MSMELFKGYGVPVKLSDEESFLKVRETLTRIGIASRKEKTLWQSCHILHKQGFYHILHFKELFMLDGRTSDISETDIARRNTITLLLQDWDLVKVIDNSIIGDKVLDMSQIKVLSHKEKFDWKLEHKYSIGSRKVN
nr:MAG: hypothetical protein [Caudoviricetes sp.]